MSHLSLADGGSLFYEIHSASNAAPWLLLIRALGGTIELWGEFRVELAKHFRVLSFDARGLGRSSGSARTSTSVMARDAIALLDELSIERAHVFGQSLGGMVATWMPVLAPSRIDGLVLASTARSGAAFERAGIVRGLAFTACMARPRRSIEACLARNVVSDRISPERLARAEAALRAHPSSRESLARQALAGARHRSQPVLAQIPHQTLVLAGACDELLGVSKQRALADSLENATFAVIPDSGHDLTLERPLETARKVRDFLLS